MCISIFYLQLYRTDYVCLAMMSSLLLLKVQQLPIFVFEISVSTHPLTRSLVLIDWLVEKLTFLKAVHEHCMLQL